MEVWDTKDLKDGSVEKKEASAPFISSDAIFSEKHLSGNEVGATVATLHNGRAGWSGV